MVKGWDGVMEDSRFEFPCGQKKDEKIMYLIKRTNYKASSIQWHVIRDQLKIYRNHSKQIK